MMEGMELKNWAGLGEAVRARRAQLGMTQHDVEQAGGPSDVTLSQIEQGTPRSYQQRTRITLERALQWKPGAVEAILAGEDPAAWVDPTVLLVDGVNTLRGAPPGETLPLWPPAGTQVSEWVPEVTSAGLGFLDLLDKHCGADPDAVSIRRAVVLFVKKINEGGN
jgi:transcriptional regulator with XRE-family HTH domain